MENLTTMTNENLEILAKQTASNLSYYNAAEGNWLSETQARNECKRKFYEIMKEYENRGLIFSLAGYLI